MKQRERISLAGEWRFALDPEHQGTSLCGGWYNYELPGRVKLPGGTADNRVGIESAVKDIDHFNSRYQYVGAAWYQKDVTIPEELEGKRVELFMERSARSRVWVDGSYIGSCDRVQMPQRYDLGKTMYPGKHTLSIECDNSPARPLQYGGAENGIKGDFYLEITDPVWIRRVRLTPDVRKKRVQADVWLGNESGLRVCGRLCVHTQADNGRHTLLDKWVDYQLEAAEAEKKITFELFLGEGMQLWDEFEPVVYWMELHLTGRTSRPGAEYRDVYSTVFGMREFKAEGTQIAVNGRRTFLRGTLDTDTIFERDQDPYTRWKDKLAIYRQYGLNHLRFHSGCPGEDAFRAADELGFYLQVELKMWADIAAPDSEEYEPMLEPTLKRQGEYLVEEYGHHPSFCMVSLGNEHSGYRPTLEHVVEHLKAFDPYHLYAQGSNAFLDNPSQGKDDDYWVTMKLHAGHYPARGSFSHFDAPLGPVQDEAPNTRTDLTPSMKWSTIPVIGHEVGQYETFPDFDEINQFPEDIIPGNLILFRQLMERQGMLDLEKAFRRASGKLCLDCYRQELELFARTRGFGGYQMLALCDCLGQGSSLVGVLNIFMKSKGMVTPEEWRRFCAPHMLLLRMDKYSYKTSETFRGLVQMANYGPQDICGARVRCSLSCGGRKLWETLLPQTDILQGTLTDVGQIQIPLDVVSEPCQAQLKLSVDGSSWRNEYPLWLFPEEEAKTPGQDVYVAQEWDDDCRKVLEEGGRVLLFPENLASDRFVEGYYASNFWSYEMFKNLSLEAGKTVPPGTLGLYIDKEHPLFEGFPTQEYSQWHWWHIVQNSTPVVLDGFPEDFRPVVSVIDNPMRCLRLGLILEARVGRGRLLLCASRLTCCLEDPAAKRLYNCLLRYASSERFDPPQELSMEQIAMLF